MTSNDPSPCAGVEAAPAPVLRVVVPAHEAANTLGACLDGVGAAGFAPHEVVVVDDGSRDETAAIARAFGATVVVNDAALRPARARNRGAAEADAADVILFVDADVVLRCPARAILARHFADPSVTALIGAYDDRADGGSVVSDYRNLLHHHVHVQAAGPSDTFWTGIGAVRRDAFLAAGGFESAWENIEDVEFGLRLTEAGGRIVLDPSLMGSHLKVWTLGSMVRTDLFGRAVPWTRLLREGRARTGRLNTSPRHKAAALGVALAGGGLVAGVLWPPFWVVALLGALLFVGASLPVLAMLRDKRGTGFALRALPYHAAHYAAALLGYAKGRLSPRG